MPIMAPKKKHKAISSKQALASTAEYAEKKKCEAATKSRQSKNETYNSDAISPRKTRSTKRLSSMALMTKTNSNHITDDEPEIKKAKVLPKIPKYIEQKVNKDDSELEFTLLKSKDNAILPELNDPKSEDSTIAEQGAQLPSCSKISKFSEMGSSSESEWEEVEEKDEEMSLDDYKPDIPKEGVEITIDCPDLGIRKRKKKQFDEMDWIRLHVNRQRKEAQLNIHKTHLLCLLSHGFHVNNVLNSPFARGLSLSLLPSNLADVTGCKKMDKVDVDGIKTLAKWFRKSFLLESGRDPFVDFFENFLSYFETRTVLNGSEYNLVFVVLLRTLGFKTRFCVSLYPISHKAQNLIKKPREENMKTELSKPEESKAKPTVSEIKKKAQQKKNTTENSVPKKLESTVTKKKICPRRSSGKNYKMMGSESDEDFVDDPQFSLGKKVYKKPSKKPNRKVLSSESEPSSPISALKSNKVICWAEVYSKPDKQWVSVDCANNIFKPHDIEAQLPQPVTYILAYNNESYVKDVTKRYCSKYMTSTIKLRVVADWWEETLEPFLLLDSKLDKEEEKKLEMMMVDKPLPSTVSEYKNHPLYALKRHLLKFEAIYPPEAASIGFIRGEPVYPRENVARLHSRETWLKEARVVRIGEEPYKIVKARPKWDKVAGVLRTDLPLEVFGFWQTEPYEPPVAVDGKVPRNEYGNVELFKPCMLPRGTVHLPMPGLNRIARKLGIDCSPAVVGFDGHKGSVHPVFDGFIVCEEFKDTILAAWDEEKEIARKREEEKREKRIYGNWKKLIKGLLIRERIKLKYDVK